MIHPRDKQLFMNLLETTGLFPDAGKLVLRRSLEDSALPHLDFHYLLFVMKMECNAKYVIDREANAMVGALKKKYHQPV